MTSTRHPPPRPAADPFLRQLSQPRVQVRFDAALKPPPETCEDLTSSFCSFRFGSAGPTRIGELAPTVSDRQAGVTPAAKPALL